MYNRPKKITRAQINKLIKAGKTEEIIEAYRKNRDSYFLNLSAEMERLTPGQKEAMQEYFTQKLKAGQRKFYGLTESDIDFLIKEYGLEYLNKEKIEPPAELDEVQQFMADQMKLVTGDRDLTEIKEYTKGNEKYWYESICRRASLNPEHQDVKAAFNYLVYH